MLGCSLALTSICSPVLLSSAPAWVWCRAAESAGDFHPDPPALVLPQLAPVSPIQLTRQPPSRAARSSAAPRSAGCVTLTTNDVAVGACTASRPCSSASSIHRICCVCCVCCCCRSWSWWCCCCRTPAAAVMSTAYQARCRKAHAVVFTRNVSPVVPKACQLVSKAQPLPVPSSPLPAAEGVDMPPQKRERPAPTHWWRPQARRSYQAERTVEAASEIAARAAAACAARTRACAHCGNAAAPAAYRGRQRRTRFCTPAPQLCEHALQAPQRVISASGVGAGVGAADGGGVGAEVGKGVGAVVRRSHHRPRQPAAHSQ